MQQLRLAAPTAAIVYTAAWSPSLERQARRAGADDCLDKTTPPRLVVRALREACAARPGTLTA